MLAKKYMGIKFYEAAPFLLFSPFSLSPLFLLTLRVGSLEPRLRWRCDAVGVGRKT